MKRKRSFLSESNEVYFMSWLIVEVVIINYGSNIVFNYLTCSYLFFFYILFYTFPTPISLSLNPK